MCDKARMLDLLIARCVTTADSWDEDARENAATGWHDDARSDKTTAEIYRIAAATLRWYAKTETGGDDHAELRAMRTACKEATSE